MKKNELKKIEEVVREIFQKDEKAKNDDMYLYYCYCKKVFNDNGCVLNDESFVRIWVDGRKRKEFEIKTYAAVERAARKLREHEPKFRRNYSVKEQVEKYKEYARG